MITYISFLPSFIQKRTSTVTATATTSHATSKCLEQPGDMSVSISVTN